MMDFKFQERITVELQGYWMDSPAKRYETCNVLGMSSRGYVTAYSRKELNQISLFIFNDCSFEHLLYVLSHSLGYLTEVSLLSPDLTYPPSLEYLREFELRANHHSKFTMDTYELCQEIFKFKESVKGFKDQVFTESTPIHEETVSDDLDIDPKAMEGLRTMEPGLREGFENLLRTIKSRIREEKKKELNKSKLN